MQVFCNETPIRASQYAYLPFGHQYGMEIMRMIWLRVPSPPQTSANFKEPDGDSERLAEAVSSELPAFESQRSR